IGEGEVTSPVEALPVPVRLAGRTFPLGCAIEVSGLVPLGTGVELSPLVRRLTVFPHQRSWSARLRRPLLQLPSSDVALIRKQLRPMLCAPQDVLDGYVKAVPGRRRDTRFETSRVQIRPSWPGW
ncbi:MAG TPA: hypothetical protein VKB17_05820, partial [Thermoleophilaceae bacterium]|nr:hypothetical protein [Thermoleophilaceae bacterium]